VGADRAWRGRRSAWRHQHLWSGRASGVRHLQTSAPPTSQGRHGDPRQSQQSHAVDDRDLRFNEQDVLLQKTALSFDASVWEVFAHCCGGQLLLAAPQGHRDAAYCGGCYRSIRSVFCTGALDAGALSITCSDRQDLRATTVRHLFSGGEALSEHCGHRCTSAGARAVA